MARMIIYIAFLAIATSTFAEVRIVGKPSFPSVVGRSAVFPRDHGAHLEHAVEWWYLTGHIFDSDSSKLYGVQFTLFRVASQAKALNGNRRSQYVIHFAFSDIKAKTFDHFSYTLPDQPDLVHVSETDLDLRGPGFFVKRDADDNIEVSWQTILSGHDQPLKIDATMRPQTSLVMHGDKGVSFKGDCESCATFYSSFPRLDGRVRLQLRSRSEQLNGLFWYDHEFGSHVLDKKQVGWDWFGISFNDGTYMMAFQLRDKAHKPVFSSARIGGGLKERQLNPREIKLKPLSYWTSQATGARYPIRWQVHHPEHGELEIVSEISDQEVVAKFFGFPDYYEGNCRVIKDGKIIGHAYLEMNGYGEVTPHF